MIRSSRFAPVLVCALLLAPWWVPGAPAQSQAPAKIKVVVFEGMQIFPAQIMQTKGIADKYQLQIELVKAAGPQGSRHRRLRRRVT